MAGSIGESSGRSRRLFGVRLYLALGFAAVAVITAALSYLIVSDSGEDAARERSVDIAVGRTTQLADRIGDRIRRRSAGPLENISDPGFSAWVFNPRADLISPKRSGGLALSEVPDRYHAVRLARRGRRTVEELGDGVTVVAAPIFRDGRVDGALLVHAEQPQEIQAAVDEVRGERATAALIALGVAIVLGFGIASVISIRIKRLARSAARMTEGRLEKPLEGTGGRDEIADLGQALETMRIALRETFDALSSERDRLSAIFDALSDAVMVIGTDGEVRFANAAAEPLITETRQAPHILRPWLRRAALGGAAEHDALSIDSRVYAVGVRRLAAEGAVLAVVRDRTEELRRELAEREFVSNAAHELRNPMAGISGAIEVLQGGAKDDPEAREHFLARLAEDAERLSRLTVSLLTLARMEAVGDAGSEAFDVKVAFDEALAAVPPPDGVEVRVDADADVTIEADGVLMRQVLIGLLTNAFKHTPAPGVVSLRARRDSDQVLIEVTDTGTGIAPEEVDRVFERFYRGAGSLEREGFGLGLSIAKRMVDVMGGEIGARSTHGEGSTFWVRIAAAKPAPTPVA